MRRQSATKWGDIQRKLVSYWKESCLNFFLRHWNGRSRLSADDLNVKRKPSEKVGREETKKRVTANGGKTALRQI